MLSGRWWLPIAAGVGGLVMFALGSVCVAALQEGLLVAARTVRSLEAGQPWWLLLLLLVPLIIALSFRSLAGLGPVRRWVAIGLRCALILFLTLALAEVHLAHRNETTTVLFVVDRSLSVPQESYLDPSLQTRLGDHRWDRIRDFINKAVENRGPGHERDKAGLIVFGRRPRLELPPSAVPQFRFNEVASTVDGNYTDIGAAIKLALASFPEGSGKRIILLSDGNENLGTRRGAGSHRQDQRRPDRRGAFGGGRTQRERGDGPGGRGTAPGRAGQPAAHPRPVAQLQSQPCRGGPDAAHSRAEARASTSNRRRSRSLSSQG